VFESFGLHPSLLKGMDKLGIKEATPVQESMIPEVLAGHDIQASARTGSGKSAAFFLPVMHRMLENPAPETSTRCLVLSPTRELAQQLDRHYRELGAFTSLSSQLITGGEGFREQQARLRKNPETVVGTPGRLLEHIQKKSLLVDDLECLVLDEADRMLDMGFRDEVLEVVNQCNRQRQTILLSATLSHEGVARISAEIQQSPVIISIGSHRSAHEDIVQEVILADDPGHKQQLCNWLLANEDWEKALVFTNTREHAERVAVFLIEQGHKALCLHGEMQQDERKQVMQIYRSGGRKVLVATDLAARGLDIPEISLVINFAMARSGDEYVHRIGRTGRAGASGKAVSLISPQEWNLMESIARYLKLDFIRREIAGLPSRFRGPSKKKKGDKKKSRSAAGKGRPKSKQRHRDKKNIGKRRKSASAPKATISDGMAPLKRK